MATVLSLRAGLPSAVPGAVIWATALCLLRPLPFDVQWAHAILLFASLVLVPWGLSCAGVSAGVGWPGRLWRVVEVLQLPAALALGGAFLCPQGGLTAVLALPWLGTTSCLAVLGLLRLRRHFRGPVPDLCLDVGLVYLGVGGGWTLLDRAGLRPLDFEAVIVLLTAIHFHYAGFLLPVLTGLALRQFPGRITRLAGLAVIGSVPLVALGITATRLGFPPLWECLAAWSLALAGTATGFLYFRLACRDDGPIVVRGFWLLTALSLLVGMVLAAMYASRFYVPLSWLDIPWMRAVHGTANAFGFGVAGLMSWTLGRRSPSPHVLPSQHQAHDPQLTNDEYRQH